MSSTDTSLLQKYFGDSITFDAMESEQEVSQFEELGIRREVLAAVEPLGITCPTEVQRHCLPCIFSGDNCYVVSQLSSGKGTALGLAAANMVNPSVRRVQVLIVTASPHLAVRMGRLLSVFEDLYNPNHVEDAQFHAVLDAQVNGPSYPQVPIVVGSWVKVRDALRYDPTRGNTVSHLFFDYGDAVLPFDLQQSLSDLRWMLPKEVQIVLMAPQLRTHELDLIAGIAQRWKVVDVPPSLAGGTHYLARHDTEHEEEKLNTLHQFLQAFYSDSTEQIVVFANKRKRVEMVHEFLSARGYSVAMAHAELPLRTRDGIADAMRRGEYRVLVTSDIFVSERRCPQVTSIVSFDTPTPCVYLTRLLWMCDITTGCSLTLARSRDFPILRNIEEHYGLELQRIKTRLLLLAAYLLAER